MYLGKNRKNPYAGFNRNIVECKFQNHTIIYHILPVLIETLWNVNLGICFSHTQHK